MNFKSKKESETIEYKKSVGEWKEIIETVSAFSNTRGGEIYIGINNSGKVNGVEIGKNTIEDLTNLPVACLFILRSKPTENGSADRADR